MRRILSFSRISFYLVLPLDIGFTADCFCAYTALDRLQQEIIVTSFGWKPIPSEARVTRDEVSGFIEHIVMTDVWKTVPPNERSIRVNPLIRVKKTQWRNEHGLHLRLYGAGLPPAIDHP